jgi:hypothetical protein
MRKTILISLFAWALCVPLLALTVPDGQAAVVEAVIGKARADQGHGYKAMKLGEALSPGASIKTGANGRVALTLPDGSTARVASNTELTLKDETVRKGIFTRLVLGTVRFLVMKQDKDHSFETELPNAVAAVKGTDPEYHTDGTVSTAAVFSSGNPVALLLTDAAGHEQALKAGEKLSFDGSSFKVEPLTDADTQDSDKRYKGLPVVIEDDSKKKEPDAAVTPAPASTPASTGSTDTDSDVKASMAEATDQAIKEATRDLYLDGFLTRDERTGDIAAGKLIYDQFGQQVQVSHFITKPDPQTVQISSFSQRDAGPNKGISSAIETSTYNQALPDNWGKVFASKLNDPANLDANLYPIYWKTSETFLAKNPFSDSIEADTAWDAPIWYQNYQDPNSLVQGQTETLSLNGQAVFNLSISYPNSNNPNNLAYFGNASGNINTIVNASGASWSFAFTDSNDNVQLTQDVQFLDDHGNILAYTGSQPGVPSDLKGVNANVEVIFGSPLFDGRTIDLLFLPGFYDLYDMLNIPTFVPPPS